MTFFSFPPACFYLREISVGKHLEFKYQKVAAMYENLQSQAPFILYREVGYSL
jgi:hypothetical protein